MNKNSTNEMKLQTDDIDIYLAKTKTKVSSIPTVGFKTQKKFKSEETENRYNFHLDAL